MSRAVRAAAFPFLRTVEEFDFTYQSTLRLTTIGPLLAPDFVTEGRSVILVGKPRPLHPSPRRDSLARGGHHPRADRQAGSTARVDLYRARLWRCASRASSLPSVER
jgi:hypothetical protein